jgi:hypothetical protein
VFQNEPDGERPQFRRSKPWEKQNDRDPRDTLLASRYLLRSDLQKNAKIVRGQGQRRRCAFLEQAHAVDLGRNLLSCLSESIETGIGPSYDTTAMLHIDDSSQAACLRYQTSIYVECLFAMLIRNLCERLVSLLATSWSLHPVQNHGYTPCFSSFTLSSL